MLIENPLSNIESFQVGQVIWLLNIILSNGISTNLKGNFLLFFKIQNIKYFFIQNCPISTIAKFSSHFVDVDSNSFSWFSLPQGHMCLVFYFFFVLFAFLKENFIRTAISPHWNNYKKLQSHFVLVRFLSRFYQNHKLAAFLYLPTSFPVY